MFLLSFFSWVWSLVKMEKLAVNSPFAGSLQNGNQYSRHVLHLPTCSSRVFEVWQISQEIILLQSFWPGTKTKMVDFAEHKSSKKIPSLSQAYIPRMHLCVFWSSLNVAKKRKKHVFPPCWNQEFYWYHPSSLSHLNEPGPGLSVLLRETRTSFQWHWT